MLLVLAISVHAQSIDTTDTNQYTPPKTPQIRLILVQALYYPGNGVMGVSWEENYTINSQLGLSYERGLFGEGGLFLKDNSGGWKIRIGLDVDMTTYYALDDSNNVTYTGSTLGYLIKIGGEFNLSPSNYSDRFRLGYYFGLGRAVNSIGAIHLRGTYYLTNHLAASAIIRWIFDQSGTAPEDSHGNLGIGVGLSYQL